MAYCIKHMPMASHKVTNLTESKALVSKSPNCPSICICSRTITFF